MTTKKNGKKNNHQQEQKSQPVSQPASSQPASEPVAPAAVAVATPAPATPEPQPTAAPTPKEKKPTISATTRKLVILNQDKSVEEISALLVLDGWDKDDVAKRQSTIASFRTDTLATVKLAKEMGLWKS